jgi:ribosomal protein S18 acetylase RimI-like enzyme
MAGPALTLRLMVPDDAAFVEAFYSELIPTRLGSSPYRELVTQSSFALLLLESIEGRAPRIIGLSSAIRIWKTSYTREREAYIPMLGVRQKYRKRGLGSLLLNVTLAILRTYYSCGYVMCHVQKLSNPNVFHFLRARGFNAQKVSVDFYELRSEKKQKEDALFMARDLTGWSDSVTVPAEIAVTSDITGMLTTKQKLGLLARWRSQP